MALWVPPRVSRELQDETSQYRAEVLARAKQHALIKDFNRDLKAIDPRMQMLWFDDDANVVGVTPGRYHVLRDEQGAPPTLIPICGPNGEYIDPNSGLFEWLRTADLWNERANRERKRATEESTRVAERRREREREDHAEELRDRFNAAFRTSISMNRDSAWTQNAQGVRGRKAA